VFTRPVVLQTPEEAPTKAFSLSTQKTDIDQKIDDLFNI
jgi:hypothetical protein